MASVRVRRPTEGRIVGRYVIHDEIASGGMATVHIGRLLRPAGFVRTVAIKRLHPQYAKEPTFVSMFLDEARLAARLRHANVVPILDVEQSGGELYVVMEYVHGESLGLLLRTARKNEQPVPSRVAVAIMLDVLRGLHAAHEATDDAGEPLGIVHRDISPQNVLVGADGVARVVDFGIAKATGRLQTTAEGQVKGKAAYMSPEQVLGEPVDRRSDVYAAAIVLWEMLTGRRLFTAETPMGAMAQILERAIERPSLLARDVPEGLDRVVLRAAARKPEHRFATAREMSQALEEALAPATARQVEDWMNRLVADVLDERAALVADVEKGSSVPLAELPAEAAELWPTDHPITRPSRDPRHDATRRRLLALGMGGLGLVAIAFVLPLFGMRRSSAVQSVAAAPSLASSPDPRAGPNPDPLGSGPSGADADPTAPALGVRAMPTASSQPARAHAPARPQPTRGPRPPPQRNCSPPYRLDAEGVRIAKPECL